MKKTILLYVLAVLSSFSAIAQTTIKPTIGMNFTDITVTDGEAKGKAGSLIGGSVAFGKKFYVEPGIYWVGKSTEITSSTSSTTNLDAKLKGIRVPVSVGFNFLGNEKTTFALRGFGGASGFFITSVSDDIDKDNINTTNWGLFAGAGLDIWKLFLDISYEWSLTNMQKDISNIGQTEVGKTRSLFINAGIRINLK
jgi:Outer membrane protein beta-barrel domain